MKGAELMFQQRDEFFRVITVQTTLKSKNYLWIYRLLSKPTLMHSTFALLFDLLCIYTSDQRHYKLILNWNIFTSCRISSLLISLSVSFVFWACFLGLILFACPRVNGKAFDINAKPEACMFLCSFLMASSVGLLECTVCFSANFCVSGVIFTLWSHGYIYFFLFVFSFVWFGRKSTLSKHFLYMVVK